MTTGKTKITGGKFKGRWLRTPDTVVTHPMGSRERLALFNILTPYLPDALVLDAYAGSGALGLEALSRGAQSVGLIEENHTAAQTIRANISALEVEENAIVLEERVEDFPPTAQFDIVFADPPYNSYGHDTLWTIIRRLLPVIKPSGIFVLSHPVDSPPLIFKGFEQVTERKYAGAKISIFQRNS